MKRGENIGPNPAGSENLANHWHFSSETAFRIPELLDDLRHELRRNSLEKLDGVLPETKQHKIHMEFVRRVLTGSERDLAIRQLSDAGQNQGSPVPVCYQFTNSYAFETFRATKRAGALNRAFKKAEALITEVKKAGSDQAAAWRATLDALRKACQHYGDTTTETLINSLQHQVEHHIPDLKRPTKDKFHFLSLLYGVYSRLTFVGEALVTVSNHHFARSDDDSFHEGRPNTLGYLLVSVPPTGDKRGTDKHLFRIHEDGTVSKDLLPDRYERSPTHWFPGIEGIPKEDNSKITSMLGALWQVFNESTKNRGKAKTFYDLVIPVYETDDVPVKKGHQAVVVGTFLGWLFLRITLKTVQSILATSSKKYHGKKVAWVSSRGGKLQKGVRNDLKAIRFALNRFAESYLLGEMEWLLEQGWGSSRDAVSFTVSHFHHCAGWIGDTSLVVPAGFLGNDYYAFCVLKDGVLQRTPRGSAQAKDVTHLVVDVGRAFFGGPSKAPPIPIVLRKRDDTALSADPAERDNYAKRVTKSARQVFEAATQVKSIRIQEKDSTLEDISHEVKQVANALLGCWSIEPDESLKSNLKGFFQRLGYTTIPEAITICPEPRLIGAAAKVMQLWTGSRDPLSFFDQPPNNVKDTLEGVWRVVVDSASGILSRKFRFDDPNDHESYTKLQLRLDTAFSFSNIFSIESDGTLAPPSENDDAVRKQKWVMAIKVLLAKFKDIVRHAHPEKPRTVQITVLKGDLLVVIANHDRPNQIDEFKDASIRELYGALKDVRLFDSSGHGSEMLKRLERESGGFVKTQTITDAIGQYKFEGRFCWGARQGPI